MLSAMDKKVLDNLTKDFRVMKWRETDTLEMVESLKLSEEIMNHLDKSAEEAERHIKETIRVNVIDTKEAFEYLNANFKKHDAPQTNKGR